MKQQQITETKKKLQYIIENRLVNIIIQTFAVFMFYCAFVLRDCLGMLLTCFPLNLLIIYKIVYLLTKKKLNNVCQNLLTLLISIIYLLYIWQPLTDGTVGNAIREMTGNG